MKKDGRSKPAVPGPEIKKVHRVLVSRCSPF